LHITRIGRGDLHRHILQQGLKFRCSSNKVSLTIDLHQNADLTSGMNVGTHGPVGRYAIGLFRSRSQALLPQVVHCLFEVPPGFGESLLALHKPSASLLT
jgi:hypothetical protein